MSNGVQLRNGGTVEVGDANVGTANGRHLVFIGSAAVDVFDASTVADANQARERAEQIRKRALSGESFEKLAADLSDSLGIGQSAGKCRINSAY